MKTLHTIARFKRTNTYAVSEPTIYRWSPRSMSGKKMSSTTLLPLFAAASYAPSAFNAQPWKFYYASRDTKGFASMLGVLVEANRAWCTRASFLLILVSQITFEYSGKSNRTHSFDTGAAWEAFAIEGARRNVVVHAMSGFDYEKAHALLKLDSSYQVECMIAVGVPSEKAEKEDVSMRKDLDHIATDFSS